MGGRRNGQLNPDTGFRRCTRCKLVREVVQFRIHEKKNGKVYLRASCRSCDKVDNHNWYYTKGGKEYYQKWRKHNPEILAKTGRKSNLKRNYGITPEDYDVLLEAQNGCCGICGRHQTEFKKRLATDHNHKTGYIRGLLCNKCNPGIGAFGEDVNILQRAIDYLKQRGG